MSKASRVGTIFGATMLIVLTSGLKGFCAESESADHFAGLANYYADSFHGKRTASGARHDKTQLMAAHRTLPFGTKLRVVNRWNHKSCVVVVNDRGPFTRKHIIDLSYEAARQIGSIRAGTCPVDCYIVKDVKGAPILASAPKAAKKADSVPVHESRTEIVSRADDLNAFKLDYNGQIAVTADGQPY